MKRLYLLAIALSALLLASCSSKTRIVFDAAELKTADVYVIYADPEMINARTQDEIAKAQIKDGKCEIILDSLQFNGKIKECSVTIVNNEKEFACNIPMPVEKGKTVTVKVSGVEDYLARKSSLKVSYSGSKYAEDFSEFWQSVNDSFEELTKNNNQTSTYEKQLKIYKDFIKKHPENGFVYSVLLSEMSMIENDDNPIVKYCGELANQKSENVWQNYLAAAYKQRVIKRSTASTLVLSAKDINGNTVTERNLSGKLILVDFWATWCKPCKESIPVLKSLYDKYKDKGLTIVSVSVDQNPADWEKYAKANPFAWTSVLGNGQELTQRYDFQYIPYVLLADKDGNIIKRGVSVEDIDGFISDYLSK